ncbi:peptidyl-prolyl cis-trans isomerase D [Thiogranum longum]|uniref:Periplasmic chaperone PpiD n=1 Tax=Thiogranum longum TaxID=1537524 RepID=A0A4R1H956_9GAMM|nr:SurA N-terminal domain-containing protein [Thiogranum longum]TCK17798.1 peptidyl-prolyl cis-trans isomerase D [Thiogranum longum]
MLQAFRERVMGWLGWVIIGLVIMTFALFGLGSYLQDKSQVYAAKVNDTEISPRELQQAYQQQRARMQEMMGDAYNPALIDDALLRKQALDGLINRELLLQAARDNGLTISDALLAAQIHAIPAFQEDGEFSEKRYRDLVTRRGQTVSQVEYATRNSLLTEQLLSGVGGTVFVTAGELDRAYRLQNQKRDFAYLIVSAKPFESTVKINEEQIKTYYEKHIDDFIVPERVKLSYLRLNSDGLGDSLEVNEADLEAYYEARKVSLKTKEQRRASHILISVAADADEETVAKARAEADAIRARLAAGADFAELAKENSDDPGSAKQGGDLGFFNTGDMVPEFDKTVFAMEKGDVSEPIRTQFGFHIIKLTDVKGGEIPPLAEIRDDLVREMQQEKIDEIFYEQVEQLTNLSYENPDSLDAAAEALGLEVQSSDWLDAKGGPGIGQYPKVVAAAFSDDVLEGGNNSEPVEVGPNDVIVVRVEERQSEHQAPLEDVRDEVIAGLKQELAAEAARSRGESLMTRLEEGGATLEELNNQDYYAYRKAEGVTRATGGFNPEVMHKAFTLARPQEGKPVDYSFALSNGDFALIRLTAVTDGDPSELKPEQRTQMARGYENMYRSLELDTLIRDLRARADIVIPQDSE